MKNFLVTLIILLLVGALTVGAVFATRAYSAGKLADTSEKAETTSVVKTVKDAITKIFQRNDEDTSKDTSEEEVIIPVIVTKAARGAIADFFQTNGEIVSVSSVDIYADARGILARLYVELGDYVQANWIIAEVDPSQPGLTYALSPVRAKVSGTITSLPLNQGDAVSAQKPIATIGDLSRLQVVTAIPERYISRIRIGLPTDIYLEAWPEYTIPLSVSEIDPVVDPASRAMKIKMNIPSGETRAKAGMYAGIRITIEEKEDVVKIPTDAVLHRFGGAFVFVVEEDVVIERPVVLGISQGGIVEIVEGLEAEEIVVIQGQTLLEDADRVRIREELQVVS